MRRLMGNSQLRHHVRYLDYNYLHTYYTYIPVCDMSTLYLLIPKVTVELLEAEQTLVEVFIVQLWIKVRHTLLTQQICT